MNEEEMQMMMVMKIANYEEKLTKLKSFSSFRV